VGPHGPCMLSNPIWVCPYMLSIAFVFLCYPCMLSSAFGSVHTCCPMHLGLLSMHAVQCIWICCPCILINPFGSAVHACCPMYLDLSMHLLSEPTVPPPHHRFRLVLAPHLSVYLSNLLFLYRSLLFVPAVLLFRLLVGSILFPACWSVFSLNPSCRSTLC
jgi:hypothetical protein